MFQEMLRFLQICGFPRSFVMWTRNSNAAFLRQRVNNKATAVHFHACTHIEAEAVLPSTSTSSSSSATSSSSSSVQSKRVQLASNASISHSTYRSARLLVIYLYFGQCLQKTEETFGKACLDFSVFTIPAWPFLFSTYQPRHDLCVIVSDASFLQRYI